MNQNSGQIFLRWGRPKSEKSPILYGTIKTPDGQEWDVGLYPTAFEAKGNQQYPQPGFKGFVNPPRQQYDQQQNYNQSPQNQGVTHQRGGGVQQYPQQQNPQQQNTLQQNPPPQGNW